MFRVGYIVAAVVLLSPCRSVAASHQKHYYAHDAVEDRHGVIAPWYRGQNGPCDSRVRIAAETFRRYPWLDSTRSPAVAPGYPLSSYWSISPEGAIRTRPLNEWMNGDQRPTRRLHFPSLPTITATPVIRRPRPTWPWKRIFFWTYAQTGPDHSWPDFLISVPTKGKPYGKCDPHGFIQLDLAARAGDGLLRAYQLIGNRRWFDAAKHWGDVLAAKRNRQPGVAPWGRYANPEDVPWGKTNRMTGGVVWIARFLDSLIRLGHLGTDRSIVERDAARTWLRDRLLPEWTAHDTWGNQYWDWQQPTRR